MIGPKRQSKPKTRPFGVFCLENWGAQLTTRDSVRPLLELLDVQASVRFVHRQVRGRDDFIDYLRQWASGYDKYTFAYIACHGDTGKLYLGSEELTLGELGMALKQSGVSLKNRLVYFGSCAVMGASTKERRRFVEDTGAAAICGYTHEEGVDWLESAAFELLLVYWLAESKRTASYALRDFRNEYPQLARQLFFDFYPKPVAQRKVKRQN